MNLWTMPHNKWLKGYWAFNAFLLLTSLFLFGIVMVPDWVVGPVVEVRKEFRTEKMGSVITESQKIQNHGDNEIEKLVKEMSAEEKVGQLMAVSFHSEASESGELIKAIHPGFVGVFEEGKLEKEELIDVIDGWQKQATQSGLPRLMVMVDQEGGRVQRLKRGFELIPSWEEVCQEQTTDEIRQLGRQVGEELKSVGVDGVWAPVVDRTIEGSLVLRGRTCSDDPEQIVKTADAYLWGLKEVGVLGVIKHYPGLGGTKVDPHTNFGVIEKVDNEVFLPFLGKTMSSHKWVAVSSPAVMVTHVGVGEDKLPCTVSGRCLMVLNQLRQMPENDFLVFSDAMEMDGLANKLSPTEAAYEAVMAGVDVLVYGAKASPEMQVGVYKELVDIYGRDEYFASKVDENVMRIVSNKAKYNGQ